MDLSPSFRYVPAPARIHAGHDALDQLAGEVQRVGARRAFVVCGRSVAEHPALLPRVLTALGELHAGTFTGVKAESPLPSVMAGVQAAREAKADLIVAVGGGSAVVTARALTILLAEDGDARELCTQYPPGQPPVSPRLLRPKLPNIIVLTTPTTAANRAGAAVMDVEQRHRLELFDPKTRPAAVLLDAGALLTAPASLYRSTATTTLCGVAGALQAPRLNPLAHADLRGALDLLRACLPRLATEPDDPTVRLHLATAAIMSNRAADTAAGGGGGVVSGIAHQLHIRYEHIDQGAANAVLAVPGMRFNREVLAAGQARLAEAFGVRTAGMSERAAAAAGVEAFAALLGEVGMPRRLRDLGVPQADLPAIAADAMHDFFLRTNPRPVRDASEVLALLQEAW